MFFNVGDCVSRNSHGNDMVFRISNINGNIAYLNGVNVRLCADSDLSDLKLVDKDNVLDDDVLLDRVDKSFKLDRSEYFYLPGKILHIDADEDYLDRCTKLYNKLNIMSYGICLNENEVSDKIVTYLKDLSPDILVITGHDAYYKEKNDLTNLDNYKNSHNFVNAVINARNYEKSQEKLVIIAGACQSDYEELIKAGATFASSPKRVNIHALDPAIVASSVALSDRNKPFDLIKIIDKTKYGKEGIGGVITNGCMYVGYPR